MIIDLILERQYGIETYNAEQFYREVMEYESVFSSLGRDISYAMDYGTNKDIQNALCNYVIKNDYNIDICKYIKSVEWI